MLENTKCEVIRRAKRIGMNAVNEGNKLIVVVGNNKERAWQIKQLIESAIEKTDIFITDSADVAYKTAKRYPTVLLVAEAVGDKRLVEQMILRIRNTELISFLPIILLHTSDEYREYAFCDWNCMGYFTYPLCKTDFIEKVKKAVSAVVPDERDNSFVIRRHNVHYPVRVKELVYVKFYDRALHLYMSTGEVFIVNQRPIQMIVELARARCIIRCGRGMLVNLMHVEEMDFVTKEIRLTTGSIIKIGESYERELKEVQIGLEEMVKRNESELNIM